MNIWKTFLVFSALCYLSGSLAILELPMAVAASGQLGKLPGRWKGAGSVKFEGGSQESVKCIATYFLNDAGKSLQQNLRCSTLSSYKISARSELLVSGDKLAGTWVERNTGNEGTVAGKITSRGFNLSVTGAVFTAAMRVQMAGRCAQNIRILPTGLGVEQISIELRKC